MEGSKKDNLVIPNLVILVIPLGSHIGGTGFFFFNNLTWYCIVYAQHNVLSSLLRYDPSTGIYGMDFYVVLERPGYRVGRRRRCKSRVGIHQRVTKDDAMKWFQVKYEGVILNKSQNI